MIVEIENPAGKKLHLCNESDGNETLLYDNWIKKNEMEKKETGQ